MSDQDNIYVCSRCSHRFPFPPEPGESQETCNVQVKCPACGTTYVRKVFTFPKGYSRKPHS